MQLTPLGPGSVLFWAVRLCCLRLVWICSLCRRVCCRLRYTSDRTCWLCSESFASKPSSLPSWLRLRCLTHLSTAWISLSVGQKSQLYREDSNKYTARGRLSSELIWDFKCLSPPSWDLGWWFILFETLWSTIKSHQGLNCSEWHGEKINRHRNIQ